MTYRILSFDGGGYRGVFSLRVMQRLQNEAYGILYRTNMMAGTSTGGLIALGLAAGYGIDDLLDVYETYGLKVFADSAWDDIADLGSFLGAEYSIDGLRATAAHVLGVGTTLGDLKRTSGKDLLISAYGLDLPTNLLGRDVQMARPKFFSTLDENDCKLSAVDVAIATAAAPTYFPVYKGYTDGGVVTPNPILAAVTETLKEGQASLDSIQALSIGTGVSPFRVTEASLKTELDWGALQWAKVLPNIVVDGQAFFDDTVARNLLPGRYVRIDSILETAIPMDGVKYHNELLLEANRVNLTPHAEALIALGWGKLPS